MRLDKFLKVSRLIKRRTVSKNACTGGRVELNGKEAKAGAQVKEGDVITIHFGEKPLSVKIKKIIETSKKDRTDEMFEVVE